MRMFFRKIASIRSDALKDIIHSLAAKVESATAPEAEPPEADAKAPTPDGRLKLKEATPTPRQ